MTREEAIIVMRDTNWSRMMVDWSYADRRRVLDAIMASLAALRGSEQDPDTALAAPRDALRRQDGCDVCNHDGFDEMVCYIPTGNGDGLMVISNYCPNCGCEISKQAIKYGAGYVDQDILRSAT